MFGRERLAAMPGWLRTVGADAQDCLTVQPAAVGCDTFGREVDL
jgi:hypothetical protein